MELSDEILTEMGYVIVSTYRVSVLRSLSRGPRIPKAIAGDMEIGVSNISPVLRQLTEHGLIECINPDARKGRLYRLTETGEVVCKNMDSFIG